MDIDRVNVDPNVCNGKHVIRGKRITVQTILEYLAAGDTIQDILEQYPSLEEADIKAALAFAAQTMQNRFSIKRVS